MVDEKAVDAAIAVFEWVDEDKGEGLNGCSDDRIQFVHPRKSLRHLAKGVHEGRHVRRARADEMHQFAITADGLADEVLNAAPGRLRIAWIDNEVLQPDKFSHA